MHLLKLDEARAIVKEATSVIPEYKARFDELTSQGCNRAAFGWKRKLDESLSKRTVTILDAARQWDFAEIDERRGGDSGGASSAAISHDEHEHEAHERLAAAGRGMAYAFNQKTTSYNSEALEQLWGHAFSEQELRQNSVIITDPGPGPGPSVARLKELQVSHT